MDPHRQPLVPPASCPGNVMPVGAPVHVHTGQHRMLAPGQIWQVHKGLLGVQTAAAAPDIPMALLGPSGLLAPMLPVSVLALQPLTLHSQPWPPPLERMPPDWWQAPALNLQALQWQTAQWAWCREHHSPAARSASWSLLALACSQKDSAQRDAAVSNGSAFVLEQKRLHPRLSAAPGLHWPVSALLQALGQTSAGFQEVIRVLGQAGAWLCCPPDTDAEGSAPMDAGSRPASGQGQHPQALVFGPEAALQTLACDCHRPLIEALQANASASATLMPSTPADRMPPA